jgi:hypothetical protein
MVEVYHPPCLSGIRHAFPHGLQRLEPSVSGGDDGVGVGAPDEGLGALVVFGEEAVDGGLQVDDGAEHAVFQASPGQLDVSLEATSVCVVDGAGWVVREAKVPSEPEALVAWFAGQDGAMVRIGLEAGPLSQWLFSGMADAGLPVELLETRHVRTALKTMTIKTDRKDARGIAHLMRMGWFRPVHCKSASAQEVRALPRRHRRSDPQPPRGTILPRLLRLPLLPAALRVLRPPPAGGEAQALEHRRLGRRGRRGGRILGQTATPAPCQNRRLILSAAGAPSNRGSSAG